MPNTETARHKLPYLAVAQAQKEITHNEALARIDMLLHPVAQDRLSVPPAATDADIGKCWLIDATPTAEWVGKAGQIACWIGGGWRYYAASQGMRIRLLSLDVDLVRSGNHWVIPAAIADPSNGAVIDVEARLAIATLLSYFRTIGQVTS